MSSAFTRSSVLALMSAFAFCLPAFSQSATQQTAVVKKTLRIANTQKTGAELLQHSAAKPLRMDTTNLPPILKLPTVLLPDLKPEDAAVTVNGSVLTWGAMRRYAELMLANFRLPDGVSVADFEKEKDRFILRNCLTVARHFITKSVLAQEAARHQLRLTDVEFAAEVTKVADRAKTSHKAPEAYLKELKTPGSFILIDLTNILMTAKLEERVIRPSIQISEEDIAAEIRRQVEKNKELSDYNANLPAMTEALLKKLHAGTNFADLAQSDSDCPSSMDEGVWGTFKRGDIRPEIADAAFKMEEGALSGVVETPYSFHILKILKKNRGFQAAGATEPAPVISVKIAHIMKEKKELLPALTREQARENLLKSRSKKALGDLIGRLIKEAKIDTPFPLN